MKSRTIWTIFNIFMLSVLSLSPEIRQKNLAIIQQIDLIIVLQSIVVLVVVASTGYLLSNTFKLLNWSLFSLFSENSDSRGENINISPYKTKYLGPIFVILLLINMPNIAKWEEEVFRLGLENWQQAIMWSFIFGMVHCLVGVPLFAGLVISLAGMWFSYQYFEGGIESTILHHTTYNLIIGTILFIASIANTFQKAEEN